MSLSRIAVGMLVIASALVSPAQQPPTGRQPASPLNAVPKQETSVLMRAKLGSSQKVVEGLMAGDFSMIRKGGSDLTKICDSQNWRRYEDSIVTHYRSELKRGALKLVKHANDENLEGAAYTYMHTMTTCINCHEYSRNVLRIADSRKSNLVVPIPVTEHEAETLRQAVDR